jgi:hypothetical protein
LIIIATPSEIRQLLPKMEIDKLYRYPVMDLSTTVDKGEEDEDEKEDEEEDEEAWELLEITPDQPQEAKETLRAKRTENK